MKQRVGYVRGDDGVQLAWSEIGRGKPLVRAAMWMTHLQYDLESPVWAHWLRFLGGHFRAVRYDERGCGMSDWNTGDLDASHWLGGGRVPPFRHRSPPGPFRMFRLLSLAYAAGCYAFFLVTFLYAIAFVAGLDIVPRHIDNGPTAALPLAIGIDAALLLLFAVQHSGMARPGFKRWWKQIVPEPVERATYVLASTLVLALLMWQWRSLPQVVWHVEAGAARIAIYGLCASGWLLLLYSTFLINHFDLFGLRQAWFHATAAAPIRTCRSWRARSTGSCATR